MYNDHDDNLAKRVAYANTILQVYFYQQATHCFFDEDVAFHSTFLLHLFAAPVTAPGPES